MHTTNAILVLIFIIIVITSAIFIKVKSSQSETYPFFVSTKNDITHLRSGPSKDYPVILSYQNQFFPLKVLGKYNQWYNVTDYLGNKGWVYINITTKKHTVITNTVDEAKIYTKPSEVSNYKAIIKNNYILELIHCNEIVFCKIILKVEDYTIRGWIHRKNIWGVE